MNHLRNFLTGFSQAMTWGPSARGYQLPQEGFRRDQQKLRGDVKRVAQTLRQVSHRHGKVSEG
jgi:hypothetical protein